MRIERPQTFQAWATTVLFFVVASVSFSNSLFEITSGVFIALSLFFCLPAKRERILKDKLFFLILLYLAMNAISLMQSEYPGASIRGVFRVLRCGCLCLSAAYLIDSEDELRKIYNFFLIIALLVGVDALIQGATGHEILRGRSMTPFMGDTRRITGPFPHANDFSAYLSFAIFLFIGGLLDGRKMPALRRYGLWGGLVILGACLLGTYSRGAWLAVGLAFALLAVVTKNKKLLICLLILVVWMAFFSPPLVKGRIGSLLDFKSGTLAEREGLWSESLRMIQKNPLWGLGVNTYVKNEPFYKSRSVYTDNQYAHNGYLQMAAEIGILGLASFLALLLTFFISCASKFMRTEKPFLRQAGLSFLFGILAFLIHSATDTDLQSLLLVNTLWLAIGIAWSIKNLSENSPSSPR